jgi:hypothetical protein
VHEEGGKLKQLLKNRGVWILVGVSVVIGILIGMALDDKLWDRKAAWGDLPTWLAVAVGVVGGLIALGQLRSQQEVTRQVADDSHRAQAARVFVWVPRHPGRLVQSFAKNVSDFAVYEAQLWDLKEGVLSELADLGTILPGEGLGGPQHYAAEETLARTVLTFRDANSVLWVRMPNGVLKEQSAATARDSILALASANKQGGGIPGQEDHAAVSPGPSQP